jgi:hypothetical protein
VFAVGVIVMLALGPLAGCGGGGGDVTGTGTGFRIELSGLQLPTVKVGGQLPLTIWTGDGNCAPITVSTNMGTLGAIGGATGTTVTTSPSTAFGCQFDSVQFFAGTKTGTATISAAQAGKTASIQITVTL